MKKLFLLMILPLAITSICRADISVNIQQVGPDVVVTSEGSVDLSDFQFPLELNGGGFLRPSQDGGIPAGVTTGIPFNFDGFFPIDVYVPAPSPLMGPVSFGPIMSLTTIPSSGSGDNHGFAPPTISGESPGLLYVPQGYQSGDFLKAESTYANVTLNELGVDAGSYQWTTENNTFDLVASILELGLGDVNQDGIVNFLDIAPFIAILSANDYLAEADINEDGTVSFLDIGPFITLLSS